MREMTCAPSIILKKNFSLSNLKTESVKYVLCTLNDTRRKQGSQELDKFTQRQIFVKFYIALSEFINVEVRKDSFVACSHRKPAVNSVSSEVPIWTTNLVERFALAAAG